MRDDNTAPRDNQQIQDDNQTSGESVQRGQTSGDARQPTGLGGARARDEDAADAREEGSRVNRRDVPPRSGGEEGPLD
jgi:hypothetical protein